MAHTHSRPAWASTATLTLVLAAGLCALIAWKLAIRFSHIPANYPGAAALRSKDITSHITIVLFALAVAGGVSALAYFLSGRRERPATVASACVMLLAIGVFATQLVMYYAGYQRPAPAAAGVGGSGSGQTPGAGVAGVRDQMEAMAERQRQDLERTRQMAEANRQAGIDEMNRLRDAARNASPQRSPTNPPSPNAPLTQPTPSPRPSATAPANGDPPAPLPLRTPAADEAEAARKAKAALDPVREEIQSRATAFLTEADVLVDALAKPPRAVRSELDKRAKDAADLIQKANALESYFRSIDDRVERALKDAGLDTGDQIRQGMAFRQSLDTFGKASACGSYQRLFEAASDEAEALKESAGRWNYDASGQVTSKDFSLQSKLRHLREGVSTYRRGIARARATIAGDGGR